MNEELDITIHHIQNKTENYSVIFNECLRRNDLSGLAKGIWCYLMTLPPTWKVHRKELFTHFTEGRKAKTNAFNELIEKGYIRASQAKNGHLFSNYEYEVFESSLYPLVQSDIVQSVPVLSVKEPLLNTDGIITDVSNTDGTKISLSKDKDKELPEPSRDDLLPEYIKVATEVEKSGLFKKVPLFKKNSTIPVKDALYTQDMILSILKGTFIGDYHVTVESNQNVSWLENMTWDRVVSASSNPKLTSYYHPDNWLDFFVAYRTTHKSKFLSWARPQYGTVPSNCTATTPNVTMPNPGTDDLPPNILKAYKNILSSQTPNFKVKDKNTLIKHLFSIDKWVKQDYLYLDRANHSKQSEFYGSVAAIVDTMLIEMVAKWTKPIDEGFFEVGGHWWPKYVKFAEDKGVIMSVGPIQRKSIDVDIQIEEMRRKG
jgi:hypothetical protein